MGQEVLDAFWKSNDRIYNENTLLYHRLARACGLPDCAFWCCTPCGRRRRP